MYLERDDNGTDPDDQSGKRFPSLLPHAPKHLLNKVLVGSTTGKLQLWNIRTGSLIMNFKGYSSGITFIQQAPSVDIVAVGLENGEIDVRNLRYDEVSPAFPTDS